MVHAASWHLSRFSIAAALLDSNILPNADDVEMMSRLTVSCFISTVVKLRPLGSSHFERWLGRGTYLPYWLLNNHTMCNAVTYCNCQNTAHRFGCFMKCYCFVETSVLRKRRVEVPQKNAMLVEPGDHYYYLPLVPCSWFNTPVAMHPHTWINMTIMDCLVNLFVVLQETVGWPGLLFWAVL